jgi:fumarylpyruvate hydrolase
MGFAISPPPLISLPIAGRAERFPVHRVFCVGRNYAAHAREMGSDPEREAPFFFMKPGSAVVPVEGEVEIPYPPRTGNLQPELELVVAIGKGGADIRADDALGHVYGYAIGLDMTRRDLQLAAREKGRPWEFGKSFSGSAPIGPIHAAQDVGHPFQSDIVLTVNGTPRQSSNTSKLIWSVSECLAELSRYDALQPGDLLMTGTPEGVAAVARGDQLRGVISGLGEIAVRIAR